MVDITITSLDTITAFAIGTGNYLFTLDELQNASIAQGQESTQITGKQGRKLATLKRNKTVTISGTNGLVSGGLLEMQTGSEFAKGVATEVLWADYLTVSSNAATTSYKARGTSGAEIKALYTKNSDGTLGTKLTQDSTASSGKFAYNPNDKSLSFSGVQDDTEIVVYYERQISADVLKDYSNQFSGTCMLYIDATGEDKCSKVYHVQIFVPKADFSGQFSLDLGDNQTVHAFEAEALAGACGTAGEFFTYTVFGHDAADYPALQSIAVTHAPTTTSYNVGNLFSNAGMVITATYEDGTTKAVQGYTWSPLGTLTTDDTTIKISYTEGGITKTTTQAITVSA